MVRERLLSIAIVSSSCCAPRFREPSRESMISQSCVESREHLSGRPLPSFFCSHSSIHPRSLISRIAMLTSGCRKPAPSSILRETDSLTFAKYTNAFAKFLLTPTLQRRLAITSSSWSNTGTDLSLIIFPLVFLSYKLYLRYKYVFKLFLRFSIKKTLFLIIKGYLYYFYVHLAHVRVKSLL